LFPSLTVYTKIVNFRTRFRNRQCYRNLSCDFPP